MNYEEPIFNLLSDHNYVPLTVREIGQRLGLRGKQHSRLRKDLEQLHRTGRIARIKHDRYCLPSDADLLTGIIQFRQSGSAVLRTEEKPGRRSERIDIRSEDTGVALHGDRVLARVAETRDRGRSRKQNRKTDGTRNRPDAVRVIRILERARDTLTGTLKRSHLYHYVIPDEPRIIHDVLVPDPQNSGLSPAPKVDDKVVVRLKPWKMRHLNPEGDVIKNLGRSHSPKAEFDALLHRHNLELEFPAAVIESLRNLPEKVSPRSRRGRQDFRDVFTVTIDPDDAKDFDDALSLEKLDNGQIRIGVHIADVGAYVRPGSPVDREARRRGNSTYLVGTVIPMLPFSLSNGICSLVEREERLTKSVVFTFSSRGKISNVEFANTVIRSRKRLTYRQTFAFLREDRNEQIRDLPVPAAHQTGATGRPLKDLSNRELNELRETVRTLWQIAARMRARRMNKGSLDLDMPEVKIFVDEHGHADRIETIANDESHQLIEEFMLAANEAVARRLHRDSVPMIYRVHDKPDDDKLVELQEQMASFELPCGDLSKRGEVAKLLRKVATHPQSHILRVAFLRSLKQAAYRAECDGHYGLNKTFYTHFTSPIRRYSDFAVHRILDGTIAKTSGRAPTAKPKTAFDKPGLQKLSIHLSETEQRSTEAERDSVKIMLLEYFEREVQKRKQSKFEAVITDIKNHGLFIELTESLVFGFIRISTFKDDLYRIERSGSAIIGRRKNKRYAVGQHIQVLVERVDRFKRQIDFRVA